MFDRGDVVNFVAQPLGAVQREQEKNDLAAAFGVFQLWVEKELQRGHFPEALNYYHRYTLAPLVKRLRLDHAPAKRDFGLKHLRYDLPADVWGRLEPLFNVADLAGLEENHNHAVTWFDELNC